MNVTFCLTAAAMIILALLLVIFPLIRGGLKQKQSRGSLAIALVISVLLPGAAICLYPLVGTPGALDNASLRMMHIATRAQPTTDPNIAPTRQDIGQWLQVAHTYDTEQRPGDARNAYAQALKIDAKNTVAMVGWVEADMAQHADYAIDPASRDLLEQAITLEPNNQRALWLLGISNFQQQHYAEAAATWRHLLGLLNGDSALAHSVARQIAIADAKTKMP